MFESFDASASAVRAERVRMTTIANNLANVYTTRNEFGDREAFRRRLVVLTPGNEENSNPDLGVTVARIVKDDAAPRLVWDPTHPDAIRPQELFEVGTNGEITDKRRPAYAKMSADDFKKAADKIGYVEYPNVDPVKEMADAVMAARSYEANVTAIEVAKSLLTETLNIIA